MTHEETHQRQLGAPRPEQLFGDQDEFMVEMATLRHFLAVGTPVFAIDELAGLDLVLQEVVSLQARQQGAISARLPRHQRVGPALTKVAAACIATLPATLAPLPAFAALPPVKQASTSTAQTASQPRSPAVKTQMFAYSAAMQAVQAQSVRRRDPVASSQLFAFSGPMQALQSKLVRPLAKVPATALAPRLKTIFKESPKVTITTPHLAGVTSYKVTRGDSLYSIAKEVLGSGNRWREIYAANRDKVGPSFLLMSGQRLAIPATTRGGEVHLAAVAPIQVASRSVHMGNSYLVIRGDSLYRIAVKRLGDGNRWREIVAMNKAGLNGKTLIFPNQWLVLPTETYSAAAATPSATRI